MPGEEIWKMLSLTMWQACCLLGTFELENVKSKLPGDKEEEGGRAGEGEGRGLRRR